MTRPVTNWGGTPAAQLPINLDPTEIEARLPASPWFDPECALIRAEEGDPDRPEEEETFIDFRKVYGDRYRHVLEKLAPIEQDILDMHCRGVVQPRMAEIMRLSQPSICYRLHQAIKRMQLFSELRELDESALKDMEAIPALSRGGPEGNERLRQLAVECLKSYFDRPTTHSALGARFGVTQGWLRNRFAKAMEWLREYRPTSAVTHNLRLLLDNVGLAGGKRPDPVRYVIDC